MKDDNNNKFRSRSATPIVLLILALTMTQFAALHSFHADAAEAEINKSAKSAPQKENSPRHNEEQQLGSEYYISPSERSAQIEKVNNLVKTELYNPKLALSIWPEALKSCKSEINKADNLKLLGATINKALRYLDTSHCEFLTRNDESFYFLHSLFGSFNKKLARGMGDFTGMHTGGCGFAPNQVRYILDGSPAAKAKLEIGDIISSVNGAAYIGHCNFNNTAGSEQILEIIRDGKRRKLRLIPERKDFFESYISAMEDSATIIKRKGKEIGYVHIWCGGSIAHEALDSLLGEKLGYTDGLILDLRDGYGGNGLEDLDRFYRQRKSYPVFETVNRKGDKTAFKYYYDRPLVAIINSGSRSGKELLAHSLKRSARATLLGEKTAGAVLGGRLFPIDEKTSLYLAVNDFYVNGKRLEGKGVLPDIECPNKEKDQKGYDRQLALAIEKLLEIMR